MSRPVIPKLCYAMGHHSDLAGAPWGILKVQCILNFQGKHSEGCQEKNYNWPGMRICPLISQVSIPASNFFSANQTRLLAKFFLKFQKTFCYPSKFGLQSTFGKHYIKFFEKQKSFS